jgi:hypothetical protein
MESVDGWRAPGRWLRRMHGYRSIRCSSPGLGSEPQISPVYLLTCPRTREQYVGSATGEGGFWQRWLGYFDTGHGENVELKSRKPSDYQIAILEVAGSDASTEDILRMEALWKTKLQSREMGLNRN